MSTTQEVNVQLKFQADAKPASEAVKALREETEKLAKSEKHAAEESGKEKEKPRRRRHLHL